MFSFGSGVLLGTRTDVPNATPMNFGLVQEVMIEESATIKEIYGQYQYPLVGARGSVKTTGKAKVARISGMTLANLFYGVTPTVGQLTTSFAEPGTVPASSPYNVSPAHVSTFDLDQGVIYAATGLPLTKVSSSPTTGQYSVSAGVYTFSSDDAGKNVLISYTYGQTGSGQKISVTNTLLGTTPTFQAVFYTVFQGQTVSLKLNNCVSSKLSFQTKLEDFTMPEFDFSCFADAAGNVMTWSFSELS